MFNFPHIIMLILTAAACVVSSFVYSSSCRRRFAGGMPEKASAKRHPAAMCLGLILFVSDIIFYIFLAVNGRLDVYYLPLHLCTMSVYIVFVHSLIPADWIGQILYALSLPGACCALVFPDWATLPFFSYPSIRCYIAHGLMIVYIIMQTAAGIIRPKLSAIWKPVLFLCVIAPFVLWINKEFNANYMYLSAPAQGSPLEGLYDLAGGDHVMYLVYFGILTICGMTVMYLPFSFYNLIKSRR